MCWERMTVTSFRSQKWPPSELSVTRKSSEVQKQTRLFWNPAGTLWNQCKAIVFWKRNQNQPYTFTQIRRFFGPEKSPKKYQPKKSHTLSRRRHITSPHLTSHDPPQTPKGPRYIFLGNLTTYLYFAFKSCIWDFSAEMLGMAQGYLFSNSFVILNAHLNA